MKLVRKGSRGNAVNALQEALNAHGYGPLKVDGVFGNGTRRHVIQFQQAQGLNADGIVGPQTWGALLTGPAAHLAPEDPLETKKTELTELLTCRIPAAPHRALLLAIEDIGASEEPAGSNSGPQIAHLVHGYADHWNIAGNPFYPWCAIAVCAWTAEALDLGRPAASVDWKKHPFGAWFGGVAQIKQWGKDHGRFSKIPQPGDIFVMPRAGSSSDPSRSTRAGHCGLVVAVDGKHVHTIDGNVSNCVDSRYRRISSLSGFVRWW